MKSKEGDCGARVQERQKPSNRKVVRWTFMGGWARRMLTQTDQCIRLQLCSAMWGQLQKWWMNTSLQQFSSQEVDQPEAEG